MMRMPIVVASLAVATAAAAQSPAPPQPGAMVTVEGCLTREPAGRTSSAPAQYVLTDQQAPATPAATSTSGSTSSGATAAGTPAPARKMYVLRAESTSVNLANHVNQRVRATGATTGPMTTAPLAGRSPEATPNPAPTGPPGSTGTPFDTANVPTLAVTALVALNGRCEP
jgi:hypothetical protein